MTEQPEFAVILVYSISHAIRIETQLKKAGVKAKLVPTPRHLSSDCGSAVRVPAADKTRCAEIIAQEKIEFQDIVDLDR